jgi:hypothetical protein
VNVSFDHRVSAGETDLAVEWWTLITASEPRRAQSESGKHSQLQVRAHRNRPLARRIIDARAYALIAASELTVNTQPTGCRTTHSIGGTVSRSNRLFKSQRMIDMRPRKQRALPSVTRR